MTASDFAHTHRSFFLRPGGHPHMPFGAPHISAPRERAVRIALPFAAVTAGRRKVIGDAPPHTAGVIAGCSG